MSIYRQGDVIIIKKPAAPAGGIPAKDPRGIVLAEGESSGHFHQVFGRGAKLFNYRDSTQRFLTVGKSGATVRVVGGEVNGTPRHLPIKLEGGAYEIRIQQTWDSSRAAAERVAE